MHRKTESENERARARERKMHTRAHTRGQAQDYFDSLRYSLAKGTSSAALAALDASYHADPSCRDPRWGADVCVWGGVIRGRSTGVRNGGCSRFIGVCMLVSCA